LTIRDRVAEGCFGLANGDEFHRNHNYGCQKPWHQVSGSHLMGVFIVFGQTRGGRFRDVVVSEANDPTAQKVTLGRKPFIYSKIECAPFGEYGTAFAVSEEDLERNTCYTT
jgi:hypothetical protein